MAKLLYIQASPRGERSHSVKVADAFADAYCQLHADAELLTYNVFGEALPPFDGAAVRAKYLLMHGRDAGPDEKEAWREVERIIEVFKSADIYLLAVPMWNFGIPYRLKQLIDILVQPTYTFGLTPEGGYEGLVTGRPLVVAAARGGEYRPGTDFEAYDLQRPYLETVFRFMGFTDIGWIVIEPTIQGEPGLTQRREEQAIDRAREMAAGF
jgi:FMN-dependent NADH-azoreductase